MEIINAKINKVVFHNDGDWSILKLNNGKMATGVINETTRTSKHIISFSGVWQTHPKYGKQFKFDYYHIDGESIFDTIGLPEILDLVLPYSVLSRPEMTEVITNMGGVKEVIAFFRYSVMHVDEDCENENELRKELKIETDLEWDNLIGEWFDLHDNMRTLGELREHGIIGYPAKLIVEHKFTDERLTQVLNNNYYDLIAVKGIGFKMIDEIALATGDYKLGDPRRISGIMVFVLENDMSMTGNTYMSEKNFKYKTTKTSGSNLTEQTYQNCMLDLSEHDIVYIVDLPDKISLMRVMVSEMNVLTFLRGLIEMERYDERN